MKVARLPDGSPEIFHTLQGEGPSTGAPAVFLRLSRCNLHCHWCDTPYTWNFEKTPWPHEDGVKFSKIEQSLESTPAEVATALSSYQCPRIVITGGEPLLQQSALEQLIPLIEEVQFVEIETNGTQTPSRRLDSLITAYNVSPKLANSRMDESVRIKEESMGFFARSSKAIFKFVVQSNEDLGEIQDLENRFSIPRERIFLMPEGKNFKELNKKTKALSSTCISEGYRLSSRLHVQLWGDERAK